MEGCTKCKSPDTCLECYDSYSLTKEKICYKCKENCLSCSHSEEKGYYCNKCVEGTFLMHDN